MSTDSNTPPAPAPESYQEIADRCIGQLNDMLGYIPDLKAHQQTTARFVRTHQNLSNDFLATAVTAIEQMPALQALPSINAPASRGSLEYMVAFKQVLDKGNAFVRAVKFALQEKKAALAGTALQAYAASKAIARDPGDDPTTVAHVANMKRELKRKRKNAVADPQPQPQSQTPEPRSNAAQA